MITALVFAALLGASGADTPPAAQGPPAPAAVPSAKPVKTDDKDRVICHREEITGSHREEKVCLTKREWDEMTDNSQRLFREGGVQAVDRSVGSSGMPAPH